MNTELTMPNGEKVMVNLALMDSGDQTEDVYEFCALNSDWALPCKGTTTMLSHYRLSTVNKAGSRANGMTLVLVDGGKYKDQIAARMRKENGTGAWMVYQGCDLDYAEQVTAEHKITERSGGKEVQRWVLKTSHADNHFVTYNHLCGNNQKSVKIIRNGGCAHEQKRLLVQLLGLAFYSLRPLWPFPFPSSRCCLPCHWCFALEKFPVKTR